MPLSFVEFPQENTAQTTSWTALYRTNAIEREGEVRKFLESIIQHQYEAISIKYAKAVKILLLFYTFFLDVKPFKITLNSFFL